MRQLDVLRVIYDAYINLGFVRHTKMHACISQTAVASALCIFPIIAVAETHVSEAQGLRVTVETTNFTKDQHTLSFLRRNGQDVLLKIDGQNYSGCDGCIPDVAITAIAIEIKGSHYSLPKVTFSSLFNPHLGSKYINPTPQISISSGIIQISFGGGDGAGSYNVQWQINSETLAGVRHLKEHPSPEIAKVRKFKLTKPNISLKSLAKVAGTTQERAAPYLSR